MGIFDIFFKATKIVGKEIIKNKIGIDVDNLKNEPNFVSVAGGKRLSDITLDDRREYRKKCGVYKMRNIKNNKVEYVGRAVEHSNGAFSKRLADYTRESDSARKHKSGQYINQNSENLSVEFCSTGEGALGAEKARELEKKVIQKELENGSPLINVQHNRKK